MCNQDASTFSRTVGSHTEHHTLAIAPENGYSRLLPTNSRVAVFDPTTKEYLGIGEYIGSVTVPQDQATWVIELLEHVVEYTQTKPHVLTSEDLEISRTMYSAEKIVLDGKTLNGSEYYIVLLPEDVSS